MTSRSWANRDIDAGLLETVRRFFSAAGVASSLPRASEEGPRRYLSGE